MTVRVRQDRSIGFGTGVGTLLHMVGRLSRLKYVCIEAVVVR
jgi:hypothetical protein